LQYSLDIITILETDGTIRYTSLSVKQIQGYKPEELVGKNIFDKLHPEDVPKCRAALAQVIRKPGVVVTIECRFRHANGAWIHLESVCKNLMNDANLNGVVVNSRDITERKRAEEQLRLFESVVVNANDAVLITEAEPIDNLGPRIVYVNEAFTHMTGYTLEEVLGKTPRILQGPKTDRATLDKIRTALQAWQPVRVELIDYCKDGSEFWVELNIAPVADETGWYTHWISVQRDITERKRVEEEILRALEKEKELGELKSRFVSMTSHEFRTPLTTILSSVELLEYYGHKFTEQEKLDTFNQIRTAIKRMTQLLDDFLAINRVEAGKLEFKPAPLDLEKFCRELIEELQLNAGTKHIFSLVSQCQCTNACMDEKLLRHIFSNLLSNAVKYSPEGGTIHFEVNYQNEQVIFQVKDEGIGIPSEDQQQLFDLFHRARNVGNIPGTGLGLSIVKRLVDLHKGTITVASKVGFGTTFTVTLPSNRGINK
jgi:PAS domain S-box-containing protein